MVLKHICNGEDCETEGSVRFAFTLNIGSKVHLHTGCVLAKPPTDSEWAMVTNSIERLRPIADATLERMFFFVI